MSDRNKFEKHFFWKDKVLKCMFSYEASYTSILLGSSYYPSTLPVTPVQTTLARPCNPLQISVACPFMDQYLIWSLYRDVWFYSGAILSYLAVFFNLTSVLTWFFCPFVSLCSAGILLPLTNLTIKLSAPTKSIKPVCTPWLPCWWGKIWKWIKGLIVADLRNFLSFFF